MKSTIMIVTLVFGALGLLLGFATSFDYPSLQSDLPPGSIEDRKPAIQQKLFEDCIKDQRVDGELTQEEYDRCAYSIYG
jgi:hypothetical protein